VPRPPETTTEASVNSGLPPFTAAVALVIVANFAASEILTANSSTAGVDDAATGSIGSNNFIYRYII